MTTLTLLDQAATEGKLSPGAVENIRIWLTEARYAEYVDAIHTHLENGQWKELDDAFWTIIPFGTGGRRGRMYPIGSNAINDRTIGESAQGLANYLDQIEVEGDRACAIAYDTRHQSRHFAELCAGIMIANGYKVYFLDDYRSTPELSFTVREKNCCCGIMVTASHNPPSDNAVKIYGANGGQLVPPHDQGVIDEVMKVDEIKQVEFALAMASGQLEICRDEMDAAFLEAHKREMLAGPRDLKVIYSPLHGVGEFNVCAALEADGFTDVEVFGPQRERSGDFPNVPENVSNPENPAVFDSMIERAKETGAELILATDPDCDRMGAAAPLTLDTNGPWATFTGNQLGVLLADFILEQRKENGTLSSEHYVVKTLVTTEMIRRVGDSYGIKTEGNLLVGFKWIGDLMDQLGPDKFVFGFEESHGYLVGQYARDKDGAVACMLMCEMAAALKAKGQSLHEKLNALYWQHGYHEERLINIKMAGSDGMKRMQDLLQQFRDAPPAEIGPVQITNVRDYQADTMRSATGEITPLNGPHGNMLIFDCGEPGNSIAVRPSGTEPKIKMYMSACVPAELIADLDRTKQETDELMEQIAQALHQIAE